MKRYLTTISLKKAIDIISSEFPEKRISERVSLEKSPGRITAEPIFSIFSVPETNLSAMDGIAVDSSETIGASEQAPKFISNFVRVNTGNVVPNNYDSVIMIEDVWEEEGGVVIRKSVPSWQHIRPAGEDMAEGEMILPANHIVRPEETGALASYGISHLSVLSVKVGLIPTGSELVSPGEVPKPGQVIESNTLMAASMLSQLGVTCTRYPITKDDPESIKAATIQAVSENDIVVISAGSSAGTKDFTSSVITDLGELLFHGVGIKPGKPVMLGKVRGKPVLGLPGYPLAAYTITRELGLRLIERFGFHTPGIESITATLTHRITSDSGTDEFVLVTLGKIDSQWIVTPQSRGSGVQMSLIRSNGLLHISRPCEGIDAGLMVNVQRLVSLDTIENSFIITGSHDPILDTLKNMLMEEGFFLNISHTGSMGGLLALKQNFCHLAPMHLLSEDGTYNVSYIRRFIPELEISLICIADRIQGIVSRTKIDKIEDLEKVRIINRQKGSGTRILFDHILKEKGLDPKKIKGYEREATTHSAVAIAVKNGTADAGICVYSSAKSYGLEFTPFGKERYEFAVKTELLKDERLEIIIRILNSEAFNNRLHLLGGYDTRDSGQIRSA